MNVEPGSLCVFCFSPDWNWWCEVEGWADPFLCDTCARLVRARDRAALTRRVIEYAWRRSHPVDAAAMLREFFVGLKNGPHSGVEPDLPGDLPESD